MADIPEPPDRLAEPNRHVLPAGTGLHRIHHTRYGGTEFNPCRGRPTRFAPIIAPDGTCIPSLYAASSLSAAIFETVFHDVPASALFKTVPRSAVSKYSHSRIVTDRELVLAELRAPDLKKWGLTPSQIVTTHAAQYAKTARWAKAIHAQFPDIDGLIWTSAQCDPDSNFLFFGDRVLGLALTATRSGEDLLEDIVAAGRRADITITV